MKKDEWAVQRNGRKRGSCRRKGILVASLPSLTKVHARWCGHTKGVLISAVLNGTAVDGV